MHRQEYVSIGITMILIITIITLSITNIIRFSDVSAAIAGILVAGIIGILVWGFKPTVYEKIGVKSESEKIDTPSKRMKDETIPGKDKIRNTVKIRLDDYHVYEYDMRKGERITGKISANGLFSVFFLTPASLRSFESEFNFNSIDGIEDAHYFEPQLEAPRSGKFFLVIENIDNKNIIVDIELYV